MHPELNVREVPIEELVPYENNAKKHTKQQIEVLENSIREFGFRVPVIVWTNEDGRPEVVAGHARTTAAKNLGMKSVPAITCDDLSDAQRRMLTLVDNQTTMMTGWDMELLACELDALEGTFEIEDYGFESMLDDFSFEDSTDEAEQGVTFTARFLDVKDYRAVEDTLKSLCQDHNGSVIVR